MLKPILRVTLPVYATMSLMIITTAAVYEVVQDLAINYPNYSLSILSLLFFALMVIGIAPSKLVGRNNLQDVRVQIPAHWRSVILDVVSWVRTHVYSQMLLLFGFMGVFWGISAAVVYSLRAIQASMPVYLAVILAGAFVGMFLFSAGRVLYRSALAPVDVVPDDGLDLILGALPVMGPRRIEFLKKWKSGAIPPRAMRWMGRLYAMGAAGLGISAAAPFVGLAPLAVPAAGFASIAMMLGIVIVLASAVGKRRSILSEALNTGGGPQK